MGAATSADASVPTEMKRLVLTAQGASVGACTFLVETVPVPTPKSGEVLIRVVATPVNPSDYGSWTRATDCPKAIGNEGAGVVVASGGGLMNSLSVGDHVGFTGLKGGQGAYSEYVVANATQGAFSMPADVKVEDAASFFVNPYTAVGILTTVRSEGSKAFVHTAAASQLGQMMVKLAKEDGDLTILNVVRREAQAEILRGLGATHVVVTGGNDEWKAELRAMIKETGAFVAFDAVAGSMSGDLMGVMPAKKGKVFVYGGLGGAVTGINPIDMIYHAKQLEGWLLPRWLLSGGLFRMPARP